MQLPECDATYSELVATKSHSSASKGKAHRNQCGADMTRISKSMVLTGVLLASIAATAETEVETIHEQKLMIAIDDGTDHGQVFIDLDGGEALDIGGMQLGETRSVVDQNGRAVMVTRTESGFEIDVDGKKIDIPENSDSIASSVASSVADVHKDVHVEVASDVYVEHHGSANNITIISGSAIDDTTKESIRSVLTSSGHDGDVVFLDGNSAIALQGASTASHGDGERRRIKIISKEISETN